MKGLRRNDDAMKYKCWYQNKNIKTKNSSKNLKSFYKILNYQFSIVN